MPAATFSRLLLPLPLRPTMPKNSPRSTSKLTPLSASKRSFSMGRNRSASPSFSELRLR